MVKRNLVRDVVDEYQRKIALENNNVFLEGRDMWQVFAGIDGVILVYLHASDQKLIEREIGRQSLLGNIVDEEEAKKRVVDRNLADNARERGKLLLPDQVNSGEGGYHLIVDTTDLEPDDVYLAVLEACMKKGF